MQIIKFDLTLQDIFIFSTRHTIPCMFIYLIVLSSRLSQYNQFFIFSAPFYGKQHKDIQFFFIVKKESRYIATIYDMRGTCCNNISKSLNTWTSIKQSPRTRISDHWNPIWAGFSVSSIHSELGSVHDRGRNPILKNRTISNASNTLFLSNNSFQIPLTMQ